MAGLVVSLVGTDLRIGDWRQGRCLPVHAHPARPDGRPRGGRRRLDRNSAGLDTRRDRLLGFGCPGALGLAPPAAPPRWPSCSWSGDLALANARLVSTVPQAEFDAPPEAARLIEAAERSEPSPGPFRVHRMPGAWFPVQFGTTHGPQRYSELIAWSRETLFPLYALPMGLEYCTTIGSLEIEDYVAFFHPRPMPISAKVAQVLGVPAGLPVVYFPRRSFDLWVRRLLSAPRLAQLVKPGSRVRLLSDTDQVDSPRPECPSQSAIQRWPRAVEFAP